MLDYNSPRFCVSDAGSPICGATNFLPPRYRWGKHGKLVQYTNFNHFINLS